MNLHFWLIVGGFVDRKKLTKIGILSFGFICLLAGMELQAHRQIIFFLSQCVLAGSVLSFVREDIDRLYAVVHTK